MNIDEYLADGNSSVAELAEQTGVTVQAISQYRSGKRIPRPRIARRIVEASGGKISYEDIYADREKNNE